MINCSSKPNAIAHIKGGDKAPHLTGIIRFYQKKDGVLIVAQVDGLPQTERGFFGFHIHEGTECVGEDFAETKGHYNPGGMPHPNHAGDLPPLLAAGHSAYLAVKTNRFTVRDIIGRTVVIHSQPDDFTTQPAGNAGTKIACGVIEKG